MKFTEEKAAELTAAGIEFHVIVCHTPHTLKSGRKVYYTAHKLVLGPAKSRGPGLLTRIRTALDNGKNTALIEKLESILLEQ